MDESALKRHEVDKTRVQVELYFSGNGFALAKQHNVETASKQSMFPRTLIQNV